MASRINDKCAFTPSVLGLFDANANLRSSKERDVAHRLHFLAVLADTRMKGVTRAQHGADHITLRSATCAGVQNDFVAIRGAVTA